MTAGDRRSRRGAMIAGMPSPEPDLETDLSHMEHAVEQARLGLEEGGVPIGAAVVVDGELLGVCWNRRGQ